ncbi:MAG: MogA/MoaB family molybdenum cofactor biosynthesis protein [Propionibacteriaceae bacterium]|nr:MogA/MoaB family molybdenum cofactor biosynthesis protein [Micropruina sp.]
MDKALRAAVVTISDEVVSGADEDRAGPIAVSLLGELGIAATLTVVPDDQTAIRAGVWRAIRTGVRVVIASGGTGIGPRDVTVEAVAPLLTYQIPGLGEEIRRRGAVKLPEALVSRAVAGVILGDPPTFVLAVPGSRGGIRDAIEVVGPMMGYIVDQLDGAGHG